MVRNVMHRYSKFTEGYYTDGILGSHRRKSDGKLSSPWQPRLLSRLPWTGFAVVPKDSPVIAINHLVEVPYIGFRWPLPFTGCWLAIDFTAWICLLIIGITTTNQFY